MTGSMKNILRIVVVFLTVSALLPGCASKPDASRSMYDLGPLRGMQPDAVASLPPVSLAEVEMPAWLDGPFMFYRLNYANDQQPRSYAGNRWISAPGKLFSERLKLRLAQAGGVVLSASDGAAGVRVLRIEADDFTQVFEAPGQSAGRIGLRASVFNGRALVAQKTFQQVTPAPSADAEGGAKALAAASDAIITQMIAWLAALPAPQQ